MIFPHSLSAWLWLLYCGCIGYELPAMIRAVRQISQGAAFGEMFAGFPRWVRMFVYVYVVVCTAPLLPLHTVQRLWAWVARARWQRREAALTNLAPMQIVATLAEGDNAVYEAFELDPAVIYDPYMSLKTWVGAYLESGQHWQPGGYLVRGMGIAAVPVFYTAEEFAAHFEAITFINPPHDSLPG